ncbi:MAG: hypothetical protein IT160_20985 [Bryobacterales bacterium]|nr:hypothetical protein [Bryobacterales bacterium]
MPYAFLILATVAFGTLGILHKVADFRQCRAQAVNLFVFLGAAVAMGGAVAVTSGSAMAARVSPAAIGMALLCGLLASLATLNFQHGIRHGRISTSWLVINLSTALPTVLSIVMYKELVSVRRACGLLLAVAALVILWLDRRREERDARVAVERQKVEA